jgi:hypothetical protein
MDLLRTFREHQDECLTELKAERDTLMEQEKALAPMEQVKRLKIARRIQARERLIERRRKKLS